MICIVGLGNPGKEYENTPHNLGRGTVEHLATILDAGTFSHSGKFRSSILQAAYSAKAVLLSLPDTYMNLSGEAVSAAVQFYKIAPQDVWVVHDDADLPLGNIRISFGANAAGHHGAESVIAKLGTKEFWRFRIGAAPSHSTDGNASSLAMPLDAYVLSPTVIPPTVFRQSIEKTGALLLVALKSGAEEAQKQAD